MEVPLVQKESFALRTIVGSKHNLGRRVDAKSVPMTRLHAEIHIHRDTHEGVHINHK
jgi:hypothetical protein